MVKVTVIQLRQYLFQLDSLGILRWLLEILMLHLMVLVFSVNLCDFEYLFGIFQFLHKGVLLRASN